MIAAISREAEEAGEAAAAVAVERAVVAVAGRLSEAGFKVEAETGAVRVRAAGLRALAFGSRRRAADVQLAMLVRGEGR